MVRESSVLAARCAELVFVADIRLKNEAFVALADNATRQRPIKSFSITFLAWSREAAKQNTMFESFLSQSEETISIAVDNSCECDQTFLSLFTIVTPEN